MLGKFINHCEDSLTASVFTHLLHLPSEVFWKILSNACYYTDCLPKHAGEPLSVEPFPNWNPKGTVNTNRVIPDLFIRFANFDLIVEAKRRDADMQDPDQWEKEVTAYANEFGEEKIPVRMIALGGVGNRKKDEEVPFINRSCTVHMCKWEHLLAECKRMKKEMEGIQYKSSQTYACARTITHLIDLFAWHGFSTGQWFSDFNFEKHRLSPLIISCLGLFQLRRK